MKLHKHQRYVWIHYRFINRSEWIDLENKPVEGSIYRGIYYQEEKLN